MQKECDVLEMGKSEMTPTFSCKLGRNIKSIDKEDKYLGVVMQNNWSLENVLFTENLTELYTRFFNGHSVFSRYNSLLYWDFHIV